MEVRLLGLVLNELMQNQSPDNILPKLLNAIRQYFGMEIAFISRFFDGRRYFRYVDSNLQNPGIQVGGSDPFDAGYCKAVVDRRLPELITNAQDLPEAQVFSVTKSFPIGAHLSVPLTLRDGDTYGTFCCFSRTPDDTLNQRDLQLMHVFADIAAKIIDTEITEKLTHLEMKERINSIIENDLLSIVFQPIYNIDDDEVVGFESLSRFNYQPYRSPDVWFGEAGAVGMQKELELMAIGKALDSINHLPAECYLSVNISPKVLLEADLTKIFEHSPMNRVLLEVTEHDIIETYEDMLSILKPYRERGLRLAVDDAGAGYASFRHILALNPDIIKLDVSIIRNIDNDAMKKSLASGLLAFANANKIRIIAEGVDKQSELETLKSIGVKYSQGFLLAKPLSPEQMQNVGFWS